MNQPAKLLIVDDEELIRLNLRALLEDLGYGVSEAANGREGLGAFDRERPDLVLADLMMPVMDGLSMIAALREKSPETPVIVISGIGTIREAVDSLRLGAWDYLMKPVKDAEGLDISIRRALEKSQLMRDNRLYQEHLEKTAEALRRSEERYTLAVEGANDIIWDVNLATGEMYHSERITSILGYGEHDDISLVLSDIVMPGKNGKEVLDEIRKMKPGIKVVFISGYAADVIKDRGMLDEGTEFVRKPFDKNVLLRKVRDMLGRD
jgi:DNA-binding NtrC family response regulator